MKSFLVKSQLFPQSSRSDFFTYEAKQVFTKLKQTFIDVLILYHFDLNCYICIETDIFDYTIDEILS